MSTNYDLKKYLRDILQLEKQAYVLGRWLSLIRAEISVKTNYKNEVRLIEEKVREPYVPMEIPEPLLEDKRLVNLGCFFVINWWVMFVIVIVMSGSQSALYSILRMLPPRTNQITLYDFSVAVAFIGSDALFF